MKMSVVYFFMFILIVLSVYFGFHYYVYIRIAKGLQLTDKIVLYLKIFFLVAGFSFILGEILSRNFHIDPVLYFGYIWAGIIVIAFSVFLLKDILGLVLPLHTKPAVISTIILVFLVAGFSFYNVGRGPRIKELRIPVKKLPSELSGFTIIQLSDLHLESLKLSKWLTSVVNTTNSFNPDLIVITGDLIEEDIHNVDRFYETLKRLKSKYGIVAITGNHDFYAGIDNFTKIARELKLILLRNENTTVANNLIEMVGVDDPQSRRFAEKGTDLSAAMKNVDLTKPVILLSHRPDIFDKAVESGVDLQLSGHTHVGQIPPMDLIVMLYYKYPYGLYKKNSSYLYTTSGTGTWGPPMRLFSRSEIVKIVLEQLK